MAVKQMNHMKHFHLFLLLAALTSCTGLQPAEIGSFIADEPFSITVSDSNGDTSIHSSSYSSTRKIGGKTVCTAEIEVRGAYFDVKDIWSHTGDSYELDRTVSVRGSLPDEGFYSELSMTSDTSFVWDNADFIIPGVIYGQPHTTANSKGGEMYHDAGFFSIREDLMSAPVMAVINGSGDWIAVLDTAPDGSVTQEETNSGADVRVIDSGLRFGSMNIYDADKGIRLSFRYPGTAEELSWDGSRTVRGRFNPVEDGFTQHYFLSFKTGRDGSLPETEKTVWRWAWSTLDPQVETYDLEVIKTTILDHLMDRMVYYDGRAGIPFVIDAKSGKPGSFRPARGRWSMSRQAPVPEEIQKWAEEIGVEIDPAAAELDIWPWAVIGFCGKHMELAQQFLRESYVSTGERSEKFRNAAESVMNGLVGGFEVAPPIGEGFDLRTGKSGNIHGGHSFSLRSVPEDMSRLIDLLKAERDHGLEHPEWLAWSVSHAEWLLSVQREDGTFPSDWGTDGTVSDESPVKTWAPIPFLTRLSAFTGESKWLDASIKAGDALWRISGQKGVYCGATGNSQVADKESGMLSMNAFLSLYDATGEEKWLEYAKAAADYTESWIWIWNVPMPVGADESQLGWKPDVPTVGVNGIGSNDVGGVDQYLAWAAPLYAKLYKETGDSHYYDVARVLLHGTKSMLALPGRTYDLAGPGWQQEHWRMGPGRGVGAHRTWLPWVSLNHLCGITDLEDFDKELYEQLSENHQ